MRVKPNGLGNMKNEFKIKIPKSEILKNGVIPAVTVSGVDLGEPHFKRSDIHAAVQSHAFYLGYEWREKNNENNSKTIIHWDKPGLHLGRDGRIKYYAREKDFKACDAAKIDWKEFLKL